MAAIAPQIAPQPDLPTYQTSEPEFALAEFFTQKETKFIVFTHSFKRQPIKVLDSSNRPTEMNIQGQFGLDVELKNAGKLKIRELAMWIFPRVLMPGIHLPLLDREYFEIVSGVWFKNWEEYQSYLGQIQTYLTRVTIKVKALAQIIVDYVRAPSQTKELLDMQQLDEKKKKPDSDWIWQAASCERGWWGPLSAQNFYNSVSKYISEGSTDAPAPKERP